MSARSFPSSDSSQQDLLGEEQIQLFVDSIPQLAWIARPDGFIFWYNKRWYEYTGTTPEAMRGWGWQSVHNPATLPDVMERWKESIRTGAPFDMEFPLRAADGNFRWFLTRIVPIRDQSGKLIRWFGTNTDVDELRRTQEELRRSESLLRMSQERLRLCQVAAEIGQWEFDVDNERYIFSDEACAILGLNPSSQLTQSQFISLMYCFGDRENVEKALQVAMTRNKPYEAQFRIRINQDARWISVRGKLFPNQGRNILLGVLVDVTQARKASENEAPAFKERALTPTRAHNVARPKKNNHFFR